MSQTAVLPEERDQPDVFVCDILDVIAKDDIGSMEHPMFSLSKNPDTVIRHYEHNGNSITITPSVLGLATVFDKDILIYCISQLMEAQNKGKPISKTVRVTVYTLLKATNRLMDGDAYDRLEAALKRLRGTTVTTNIKANGIRIREGFGIIDKWKIIERSPTNSRMVAIEITLSDWLYNAVTASEVLTIHHDYFCLRKPTERRLYELARKHCGYQRKWPIGLTLLHKKCGSRASLREFRRAILAVIKAQCLPEYRLVYHPDSNKVIFYSRGPHGHKAQVEDILRGVRSKKPITW